MSRYKDILSKKSSAASGGILRTPVIPAHLQIGRAQRSGPTTGGYMVLTAGPSAFATDDIVQAAWYVPFDCKIMAYGTWRRASGGVAAFNMILYSSADGITQDVAHSVDYTAGVSSSTPEGPGKADEGYCNRGEDTFDVIDVGIYGNELPAVDHVDNRADVAGVSAIHEAALFPWLILHNVVVTGGTQDDGVKYVIVVPVTHINAKPRND